MLRKVSQFTISRTLFRRDFSVPSSSESPFTLKDLIRQAAVADVNAVLAQLGTIRQNVEIPDWGIVKLGSIALAKNVDDKIVLSMLEDHYKDTGSTQRVARKATVTDVQISSSLDRILNSENGVTRAKNFYKLLIEMRFCSNKDLFISLFIENSLARSNVNSALELFNELTSYGRVKSLARTAFLLKMATYKESDESQGKVSSSLSPHISANTLSLLDSFVILENGNGLGFAEKIHSSQQNLSKEQLKMIIGWASKWKSSIVPEQLLLNSAALRLEDDMKEMLYDNLIVIYGKKSDSEGLQRVLEWISMERNWREFKPSLMRIKHFYRCMNRVAPDLLYKLTAEERFERE